ncbi:hypothetical protein EFT06_01355, partial [Staphylococcus pseudintermedius]
LTQDIEPPSTEPYARWCERTSSQLMAILLLDFYFCLFGRYTSFVLYKKYHYSLNVFYRCITAKNLKLWEKVV